MIIGGIILWHGAIADIPSGYVLCDGNNGTPDLTDRFVMGAGDTYAPDASGGNVNHQHDFEGVVNDPNLAVPGTDVAAGANLSKTLNNNLITGSTDPGGSLNPYYSLAYIMKT